MFPETNVHPPNTKPKVLTTPINQLTRLGNLCSQAFSPQHLSLSVLMINAEVRRPGNEASLIAVNFQYHWLLMLSHTCTGSIEVKDPPT